MAKVEVFPDGRADVFACAVCGVEVAETAMVYGAAPRRPPYEPGAVFCSRGCYQANLTVQLGRPTCLHCNAKMEPRRPGQLGRPKTYCSEKCRRDRERTLTRAWRALAKGPKGDPKRHGDDSAAHRRFRDDIRAARTELQMLADHWALWLRGKGRGEFTPPAAALRSADDATDVTREIRRKGARLEQLEHEANEGLVYALRREREAVGAEQNRALWRRRRYAWRSFGDDEDGGAPAA